MSTFVHTLHVVLAGLLSVLLFPLAALTLLRNGA